MALEGGIHCHLRVVTEREVGEEEASVTPGVQAGRGRVREVEREGEVREGRREV